MSDEDAIRQMINALNIEMPTEGTGPPSMEVMEHKAVAAKKRPSKKLFVQKLVTEVYVYTDLDGKGVGDVVSQHMFILGNMTEAKLKRLIATERHQHEEEDLA